VNGKYEIGLDDIRALAIKCHAFDVQFDLLFNGPTICGSTDRIRRTYNRLLSTALLKLAIAIRVSLAEEPEYVSIGMVEPAAIFLEDGSRSNRRFSVKDICDKLIHADRIYKPTEPGVRGAGCELAGHHRGQKWVLGLGVRVFCEYVLRWLDELEERKPDTSAG
jgi:hypothetical protein